MSEASPGTAVQISDLRSAFGSAHVLHGIDLEIQRGEVMSLLGPSGSGKTTLLRCIAGLERPTAGLIAVDGRIVSGDRWVPPRHRGLGMVFQDGALFPHLTVGQNIAFGLDRGPGVGGRVAELLELVGLSGMGDRAPGTLSGGQQQRVALARALAPAPQVLLLDEPFSALDASLRAQVRSEVERILDEIDVTAIFVTHDQEEAFEVGDRVAVMNHGRIEQVAEVRDLYRRPASVWVATFVGEANILAGTANGETADTVVGPVPLHTPASGAVEVLVRPEDLDLAAPAGGRPGRVATVRYRGHDALVDVTIGDEPGVLARVQGDMPGGRDVIVAYTGPPTHHWPR